MSDIVQGTEAWYQARLGKVTASRVADVVARTKTGWGASRANYCAQLIAERLTGVRSEGYTSAEMRWGIEHEPQARRAYEDFKGEFVELIGFVPHPQIGMAGASPDGLVNDFGLIEIKSPLTATHIDSLLGMAIPRKYVYQMQWQMACTGRRWVDFVSFDPRMPPKLQLFIHRVQRDNALIAELEEEVTIFLNGVRQMEHQLRILIGDFAEAA